MPMEAGRVAGRVLPESVVLAERIRDAALAVPGVVAMSPGRRYREATYGPGVTIWGVGVSMQFGRVDADVHVVVAPTPLLMLAAHLRQTIRANLTRESPLPVGQINIHIDDIAFVVPEPTAGVVP